MLISSCAPCSLAFSWVCCALESVGCFLCPPRTCEPGGFLGVFLLFTAFAKPLLMPPPLQHTPSLNLFSQITTFYTSQCHGFLPLSVPLPSAFIVSYVCVRAQSCITLCSFMGYSPPGSSIQGIFQARVLEWGAISFSKIVHYLQWNRFWLSSQIKKKVRLNIPVSFSLFMSYFTPSLPPIPSFLSQYGDFFPGLKSYVFSLAAPFF